jgi:hypothetical protein
MARIIAQRSLAGPPRRHASTRASHRRRAVVPVPGCHD